MDSQSPRLSTPGQLPDDALIRGTSLQLAGTPYEHLTENIPLPPKEGTEEYYKLIAEAEAAHDLAEKEAEREFLEQTAQAEAANDAGCLSCCFPTSTVEATTEEGDEGKEVTMEIDEDVVENVSADVLNREISRRLTKALEKGNTFIQETSKKVDEGTVSFATFHRAPTRKHDAYADVPTPMWTFLPTSPFMARDGKLDVTCKAFKTDFLDDCNNIVPPFFLGKEIENADTDAKIKELLSSALDEPSEIDLFGPEAISAA